MYLFIFMTLLSNHFYPVFFFLRKWLCNCYHKFYLMLRLVMVCRPAKAFIFYSGRPDICTAMIIIIIIVIIIMIIIRQTLMDNTVTENSSSFHCGSCWCGSLSLPYCSKVCFCKVQAIFNFVNGETGKVRQMSTTTNLMSEKNEITFQIILKNVIR